MRIPLVTSIWRGLTGMDDSLPLAWAAAKPIYESGELGSQAHKVSDRLPATVATQD